MWEINHPRNHFRRTLEARLTARRVEIPRDDGTFVVRPTSWWTDSGLGRCMYVCVCVCTCVRIRVCMHERIFRNVISLCKADLDLDERSVSLIFPIRSTRPQTHNSHLYYIDFAFKGRIKLNLTHLPWPQLIFFFFPFFASLQSFVAKIWFHVDPADSMDSRVRWKISRYNIVKAFVLGC